MRGKRVCYMHGGASTGPKTNGGRQRIRQSHWRHGMRSKRLQAELLTKLYAEAAELQKQIGWPVGVSRAPGIRLGRPPEEWGEEGGGSGQASQSSD